MPKLTVFFNGIVGFAADFKRALMVHSPHAKEFKTGNGQEPIAIPGHSAYLRVPSYLLDQETAGRLLVYHRWKTLGAKCFPVISDPTPTYVRFLNRHEVVMPQTSDPHKVDDTARTSALPTDSDRTSARWVATMEELGTPATTVDPQFLIQDDPRISAFVQMNGGTVSSAVVTDYKFVAVKPSNGNGNGNGNGAKVGTLDRAAAQLVQWDLNVADDPVVIKCRYYGNKNGGAKEDEDFEIRFKPGLANPWLVVGASSLEDLFQLSTVEKGIGEPDYHFRLLYALTKAKPADSEVILPIGEVEPQSAKELGVPRCLPIHLS